MNKEAAVHFRKATRSDIDFLSHILISAAVASGVNIQVVDLSSHPDTYQYVEGFPKGNDIGVVAETQEGVPVGAAWVRLLPMDAHAIHEPLPELTMGVVAQYQRMGIGSQLMEELYKAARGIGIPKISLGVHKDNTPAIHLYKQQNWIEDGYYHEYIMMSKEIDEGL
jgi:ribosomal protein S18 acetylase RimI-like enzyme